MERFPVTQKLHVILHGWLDVKKSAMCVGAKVLHSFCCDGEEDVIDCEFSSIFFLFFFFAGMVEEVPNAEEYLTQALASLP